MEPESTPPRGTPHIRRCIGRTAIAEERGRCLHRLNLTGGGITGPLLHDLMCVRGSGNQGLMPVQNCRRVSVLADAIRLTASAGWETMWHTRSAS